MRRARGTKSGRLLQFTLRLPPSLVDGVEGMLPGLMYHGLEARITDVLRMAIDEGLPVLKAKRLHEAAKETKP